MWLLPHQSATLCHQNDTNLCRNCLCNNRNPVHNPSMHRISPLCPYTPLTFSFPDYFPGVIVDQISSPTVNLFYNAVPCHLRSLKNNNYDNVYGAVIVAQSHFESSPSSYDEYGTVPSGHRSSEQAKRLGL